MSPATEPLSTSLCHSLVPQTATQQSSLYLVLTPGEPITNNRFIMVRQNLYTAAFEYCLVNEAGAILIDGANKQPHIYTSRGMCMLAAYQ